MKMNLIEQFGGYEKSKAHRDYLISYGSEFAGVSQNSVNELNEALLKYRIEHNIFEVGDKVIVITNALGNKFTWEVVGLDGCMVEISQIGQPNEWVHYAEITHATPEEIQAGRRLEVCGG